MYQGSLGLLEPGDWTGRGGMLYDASGGPTVFQPVAPAPGSTWLPKPLASLPPSSSSAGPAIQPPAPLPVPVTPGPTAVVVTDGPAPFGLSWGKLALGAIGLWLVWRVVR